MRLASLSRSCLRCQLHFASSRPSKGQQLPFCKNIKNKGRRKKLAGYRIKIRGKHSDISVILEVRCRRMKRESAIKRCHVDTAPLFKFHVARSSCGPLSSLKASIPQVVALLLNHVFIIVFHDINQNDSAKPTHCRPFDALLGQFASSPSFLTNQAALLTSTYHLALSLSRPIFT